MDSGLNWKVEGIRLFLDGGYSWISRWIVFDALEWIRDVCARIGVGKGENVAS